MAVVRRRQPPGIDGSSNSLSVADDPFGPIENTVDAVTSPSELFDASKPCAVYACEPPALIVAPAGLTTMRSSAGGGGALPIVNESMTEPWAPRVEGGTGRDSRSASGAYTASNVPMMFERKFRSHLWRCTSVAYVTRARWSQG